jgi:hypothetical protein
MVGMSPLWALRREAGLPGSAFWFTGGSRPAQPAAVTTGVDARSYS